MSLHHVSYCVHFSKLDDEVNFLLASFAHMGLMECMRPAPGVVGLGENHRPWLWISGLENRQPIGDDVKVLQNHVALKAKGAYSMWVSVRWM
jgi:hypothetical protein